MKERGPESPSPLDLVDFPELREILKISEAGLRIRIQKKQVPPHFKIGRRLYWRKSDIEAWIEKIERGDQ